MTPTRQFITEKPNFFLGLEATVAAALAEDIGSGDINAELVDSQQQASAELVCKAQGMLCGSRWFEEVFHQLDNQVQISWLAADGDRVAPGQTLALLKGNARALLTGERTALNLLQTLSGTAWQAYQVRQRFNHAVRILDTRKTIPGLRLAQKYAVAIGGCENHRSGLYDAFLIKENHIAASGSIGKAVQRARELAPGLPVEVEAENLAEVQQALEAGADRIMLDELSRDQQVEAIELIGGRAEIEVSGNIDPHNPPADLPPGVDCISIGSLTKHLVALDLSLRIII